MTLINLIGGQLAPNYFAALKLRPDKIVLCHSLATKEGALQLREQILKEFESHISLFYVKPFDFDQIRKKALVLKNTLVNQNDSDIILNFTGGTKPQSLIFHEIFNSSAFRKLYVDTQNECLWWNNETNYQSDHFDFRFDVAQWLRLNNVSHFNQTDINIIQSLKELSEYIYEKLQHQDKDGKKLKQFQTHLTRLLNDKRSWSGSYSDRELDIVEESGKNRVKVELYGKRYPYKKSDFWHTYITGGWFEFWVWGKLKETGAYDDIRGNVSIQTNSSSKKEIKNEIDVMAMFNGIPLFVECKSGRVTAASINNLYNMTDRYGGKYAQKLLVSLYPVTHPSLVEKLNESGIDLINGPIGIGDKLTKYYQNLVISP